jgi:hypothetical protein
MYVLSASALPVPWAAIVPIVIAGAAFVIYCLVDMVRHPVVRHLPRWAWVVLTLASNPLGGIAYLIFGRSEDR